MKQSIGSSSVIEKGSACVHEFMRRQCIYDTAILEYNGVSDNNHGYQQYQLAFNRWFLNIEINLHTINYWWQKIC